jgi:hypothetical protein
MSTELAFNELSHNTPASNLAVARSLMSNLVRVLRLAHANGANQGLRTREDFAWLPIAEGYNVAQWRNDPLVDHVERNLLRTLVTRAKLLDESADVTVLEDLEKREFRYGETKADGLGVAYCLRGLGISFLVPIWDVDSVDLNQTRIDDCGNIVDDEVAVKHASKISHIENHLDWLRSRREIIPFSTGQIRMAIEEQIAKYLSNGTCARGDVKEYSFSFDFVESARGCDQFAHSGPSHLLTESCARLIIGDPKYETKQFNTREIMDGWQSFRTHLTKGGEALRLMFWVKPNGGIVFANIGVKFELAISENVPDE